MQIFHLFFGCQLLEWIDQIRTILGYFLVRQHYLTILNRSMLDYSSQPPSATLQHCHLAVKRGHILYKQHCKWQLFFISLDVLWIYSVEHGMWWGSSDDQGSHMPGRDLIVQIRVHWGYEWRTVDIWIPNAIQTGSQDHQ